MMGKSLFDTDLAGAIAKIFGDIDSLSADSHSGTVTFEVETERVSFDDLTHLSLLLGTRDINFEGHEEDTSTGITRNSRRWVTIYCQNVRP